MDTSNSLRSPMASKLSQNQMAANDNQFKKAMEPLQELIKVTEKNMKDLNEIKEYSTMLLKNLNKIVNTKSNKEVFLDFVERNSPIKVKNAYNIQKSDYSVEAARNCSTPNNIIPPLPSLTREQIFNGLKIINNSSNKGNNLFDLSDINNDYLDEGSRNSMNNCQSHTPNNEGSPNKMLNISNLQDTPKGRSLPSHYMNNQNNFDPSPNFLSSPQTSQLNTPHNINTNGYVTFTSPRAVTSFNKTPKQQGKFYRNNEEEEKVFVLSIKAMLKETPGVSIIGRLIGPKGMNIKSLEEETNCQIFIRGKGSSKDPEKEEKLSKHPCGAHFAEPLHVVIQTADKDYKAANDRLFEAINKINSALGFMNNEKHLNVMENISCRQMGYVQFLSNKRSPLGASLHHFNNKTKGYVNEK
uniref:KH domain-containing protein n=1 Tax=Parastrongyloides trichosuri TaxID=131310 RepID=A0A0N4ZH06_PARTI